MNPDIAKQLKDAGYIQPPMPLSWTNGGKYLATYDSQGTITGTEIYVPTLSELIEACGDGFDWLVRYPARPDRALYYLAVGGKTCNEGSTPEEAVASLWLALNKKDA